MAVRKVEREIAGRSDGDEAGAPELQTLPDLIAEDLELLFVGINPGLTSARRGHYYAGPGNLFWKCLYQSGLTPVQLRPEEDRKLLEYGIGITDCVKRPTRSATELRPREFRDGTADLLEKIERCRPRLICFNGLVGYRGVFDRTAALGLQPGTLAGAAVFVVPSTSGANAGFTRAERVEWFCRLRALRDRLRAGKSAREPGDIL